MQLPPEILGFIEEYAARVPGARLNKAVAGMTEHYRGRGRTASLSLPPDERLAAYLVTRMPATFAAAAAVMRKLHRCIGNAPLKSLLDLGAGTGAASLAARAEFPALGQCTLVERDPHFARVAARLLPHAEVRVADARQLDSSEAYDLVIASYLAGELQEPERRALVERAWEAARVAMVIIEPGNPAGFHVVKAARERLLGLGARMAAPCPGEGPCPMPEDDWCHFMQRVERTSLHRRMKNAALGYEDEKFSYIAVARQEILRAGARIIRRPQQSPGLVQLTLCSGDTIRLERVTRRDPQLFRAARKTEWGDEWNPENS